MAAHPTFAAAFARELACPGCGQRGLLPLDAHRAECPACDSELEVTDVLCPECGRINPSDAHLCITCNTGLWRSCPNCNTRSWAGATTCPRCKHHLDPLGRLLERHVDVHTQHAVRTDELVHGKQLDSWAAKHVLEEMQVLEAKRLAQIEDDKRQNQIENRRLVFGSLILTAIFSVACVGVSAFLVFAR
ncbi:MAG: zinc ribbon domain-containing protein [Anaerolineales bacterium]|nr:zinc ribbon domain-containing protein [Anaerolineales bacterium]